MSSDAQDIAIARYLKQEGMVSPEQLAKALQAQARSVERGRAISLAAALVEVGAITPVQKEALDKRAKADEKKVGTQRVSHYKILKKLGEGGMGAVYLAEDARNGITVAIKVLPKRHAADPGFIKRFKREAEAAIKLDHPNIVRAFDHGEDAGYHFYAMEYCEGEPLDRAIKRVGLLSWRRSFEIARDVARGLQYAHEQGFIHRDIKPANIFMAADGTPKILDLGLTKKIDESQASMQTLSGAVLGSPHYLSPEQAKSDKSIDGRADIYSLGATLYHLLTGEPPFSGESLYEILSKHVSAELPNPQDVTEDIPDGVVHVLRRMMAKSPSDRYPGCGALVKDLELVLQGKQPESVALGMGASAVAHLRMSMEGARKKRAGTYRVPMAERPHKWQALLIWGGVGAAVILIVLAVALVSGGHREDPPDASPPVGKSLPPPVVRIPERPKTPKTGPEEIAKNKLDDLLRTLNGPLPAEKEKRIADLARFIEDNPGTFAAAMAEGMLRDLKKSPLPPGTKPVDDAWIAEVRTLAPEDQTKRVLTKLKELNPDFDGEGMPMIKGGTVTELSFSALGVTDLSPVRALEGLVLLDAKGYWDAATLKQIASPLADLRPLKGLRLRSLRVDTTSVTDITILSEMPLTGLYISGTQINDLSALKALKLKWLGIAGTRVADLTPLRAMPLEYLSMNNCSRITDFTAIAKLPLKSINCDFKPERDAAILRSIPTLEKVNNLPVAEFWKKYDTAVTAPVEVTTPPAPGLPILWKLLVDNKVKLKGQPVALQKPGLEGATFTVRDVSEKGILLDAKLQGGGTAEVTEKLETLPESAIVAWLQRAVQITPELRKSIALLYADRGRFDEARRELDRAKAAGADVREVSRAIEEKAKPGAGRAGESAKGNPPPTLTLDLGGGTTMEMVYIHPGTFTMGGTEAPTQSWQADERPKHQVRITKGYFLGKYEVARRQFAAFVKATGYKTDAERNGKASGQLAGNVWEDIAGNNWLTPATFTQADDHPVVCMSWNDAKAFCDWAGLKTGRGMRLPTEAEWEYACRAETKTTWSFGDQESAMSDHGWFSNNDGSQTHPVGQKKPNPWGLFDMHGNVWEWCQDWVGPYAGDAVDPKGPATGTRRVARSGGWNHSAISNRSAFRRHDHPSYRATHYGFRVALETSETGTHPPIDLLKLVDLSKDVVAGGWKAVGASLLSPAEQSWPRIQIPYVPPEEYDLTVLVEKKQGNDCIYVGLLAGGRQFGVILGGYGDTNSGLSLIDGKLSNGNETSIDGRIFPDDKPRIILCKVRRDRVIIQVEGKTLIDWPADYNRVSLAPSRPMPNSQVLCIATDRTNYLIRQITLTPISGIGRNLR